MGVTRHLLDFSIQANTYSHVFLVSSGPGPPKVPLILLLIRLLSLEFAIKRGVVLTTS